MSMSSHPYASYRSFTRRGDVNGKRLAPGTVKRIVGFARPYRRLIAIFLVTVVLDAMTVVVTPLLFKVIIDQGVAKGSTKVVVWTAAGVAALALVDTILTLIGRYYSSRIGEGLIYDLRTKVFDHVQRMPVAFFTRTQTGSLVSRLNSDVVGAQQAFTSTLSSVVSNVVSLVLVLGAMIILSWQITVVALLLLPLFILPARWVGGRLAAITRESMQLNAAMSQTMTERFNVAGALLVKIFGRPEDESAQFSAKAARVRDIGITSAMYSRIFFAALTTVAALATALVYGMGGVLVIRGTLEVGTLVALASLLTRLYGPLTSLSNVQVDVMTALVSFERVFEVLDLEPIVKEAAHPVVLPQHLVSVEFEGVGFRYPSADEVSLKSLETVASGDRRASGPVLHDVNFSIRPGELVALVGPSGAGKTTITSLLARLYDPTEGRIRLSGTDLREFSMASLHEVVGVVTQDAHLFHDTIRANLSYAKPGATEQEMISALRSAQVWDLVSSLSEGLDTVVGDRGHRLSGGEKQRLAIARLLLKGPGLVVLDEATAHLDSESELAVQQALDTALTGRTALVIAHRLSTVRGADQILVVSDGRIVQRGKHHELLAQGGVYADLYNTQFASESPSGRVVEVL